MGTGDFVGRRAELNALRAALDEVVAGSPRVVVIRGPAGIGKTALVRRFLADAADVTGVRGTTPAGQKTRKAILRESASLATVNGLEGLSIGDLAAALGMSKSGLYSHFGSKEELQIATVEEAGRIFEEEVVAPALIAEPGLPQLVAVCDAFFDHLGRRTFPGGCFFSGAAREMGTRPGPVKEKVAEFHRAFAALIRGFTATAVARHQLPPDEDPAQLAFELNGIILAADANFVLHNDDGALDVARAIVRRRLSPIVRDRA